MVAIICSWCYYSGYGKTYNDRIVDVLKHEEECEQRISEEKEDES